MQEIVVLASRIQNIRCGNMVGRDEMCRNVVLVPGCLNVNLSEILKESTMATLHLLKDQKC